MRYCMSIWGVVPIFRTCCPIKRVLSWFLNSISVEGPFKKIKKRKLKYKIHGYLKNKKNLHGHSNLCGKFKS